MKILKFILHLIALTLFVTGMYLTIGFIYVSWDFREWSQSAREFLLYAGIVAVFIDLFFIFLKSLTSNRDDDNIPEDD